MLARSVILFIVGFISIILGALILSRDTKRPVNVVFFLLSCGLAGWSVGIGAFFLATQPDAALFWAKVYYLSPLVLVLSLVWITIIFPDQKLKPKTLLLIVPFLLIAIPLVVSKQFLTSGLLYHSWGKEVILDRPQYLAYSVYLVAYFLLALSVIYKKSKTALGLYRKQASMFFYGSMTSAILGVWFNLFLPWFGNYRLIWIGPFATSIFMAMIAISIIRHKMFDIRLVVARSLAYTIALTVLASLYGFLVFGVSQRFFGLHFKVVTQMALSGATAIAAILFPRLRRFFDRITNGLFYRDAYDPQELIKQLNSILVSTIELEPLLAQISLLIEKSLKSEFCILDLTSHERIREPMRDRQIVELTKAELHTLKSATLRLRQNEIVAEDIAESEPALYSLLKAHNIEIIAALATEIDPNIEGIGYIILGAKKSGNPYTSQDVRMIGIIANELVIAIQNAMRFEEIERFNDTLREQIALATRRLERTNNKLRQLDETKDEFISMASHQLRTPLTSVKGYLSMVIEGDAGKITPTQHKLLWQAFISSQRMVNLIADLLNVSRLRTGKFVIESNLSNLANVIAEEVDQLRETAEARELTLTYKKPANFPTLMLDETKIRQVAMNFMDNAIYYTKPGGHIDVVLKETDKNIEFTVTDDGIGVPKHEQPHLFTKFYRAGNARKARPDGTGLGLFMAKKVVMAQGGSILFKSKEGKGSMFGFVIAKDRLQPATAPESREVIMNAEHPAVAATDAKM